MSSFWTFCARAPSGFENEWNLQWECSVLRDVHIVLDMNKTHPKRRYYLFSFNFNLDLLTLALEDLYFNTLDREKVQVKSLGCIKSRGDTSPAYCTPTLQEATAERRKRRALKQQIYFIRIVFNHFLIGLKSSAFTFNHLLIACFKTNEHQDLFKHGTFQIIHCLWTSIDFFWEECRSCRPKLIQCFPPLYCIRSNAVKAQLFYWLSEDKKNKNNV